MQNERAVKCKMKGAFFSLLQAAQRFYFAACVAGVALSSGDKLPDVRLQKPFSPQLLTNISLLSHPSGLTRPTDRMFTANTVSTVICVQCSIDNPSDTCAVLGLLVFRVVRLCRGICVLLRLLLLSLCSVNHHVENNEEREPDLLSAMRCHPACL